MSMLAALDAERLKDLSLYQLSGSRFYGHWNEVPHRREGLSVVFQWMKYLFLGATTIVVAELHPNGGVWSHSILHVLQTTQVPTNFTYYFLGDPVEHFLCLRDSIQLVDQYAKWDKPCRIRKYPLKKVPDIKDPILISECTFKKGEVRKLPSDLDGMFCFETLYCLGRQERYWTYQRISKSLKTGATFIGSCGFHDKAYDLAVLEEHGFTLDKQYAVAKGQHFFKAVKEGREEG